MINSSCRQIALAVGGLIICILWFDLTSTDLWLEQLLFDIDNNRWVWSRTEPFTRFVLYVGIKDLLIAAAAALFFSLVFLRRLPVIRKYGNGLRIVLLSLILVPACVSALKNTTNVACPRDLVQFGGDIEYTGILETYPVSNIPMNKQMCFPAGHASGGFALLSLCFLFKTARNRRRAACLALTVGWIMGTYKMMIGDHFLSHTITTMLMAWIIINTIALADHRISVIRPIGTASEA